MRFETLLYTKEGAIASVTLNRPQVLNAITPKLLEELLSALSQVAAEQDVRVVVLTGAGRAFSAGVDLTALKGHRLENGSVGSVLDEPARAVIRLIRSMSPIAIAKVNGFCFTGALELALACDIVVADEAAKLGDTHARWGLRPTWGMSARLPARVGLSRARELSFTARTFTGREAEQMGLAARAVPAADLDSAVAEIAGRILENSAASVAAYKKLYNEQENQAALAFEESTIFEIPDTEERLAEFR
jgi:enoyl-CoA hydratase/carnithine racemase